MIINGFEYVVRNVKTWRATEGTGVQADLYARRSHVFPLQFVCSIDDQGQGGETQFEWASTELESLHKDHLTYETDPIDPKWADLEKPSESDLQIAKTISETSPITEAEWLKNRLFDLRMNQLFDVLFNEWQEKKNTQATKNKWKRHFKTRTLFRDPADQTRWRELTRPLCQATLDWVLKNAPGSEVFNGTNWVKVNEVTL